MLIQMDMLVQAMGGWGSDGQDRKERWQYTFQKKKIRVETGGRMEVCRMTLVVRKTKREECCGVFRKELRQVLSAASN